MNKFMLSTAIAAVAIAGAMGSAAARDQIQVAGSSTVLPYAKIVAEQFGETFTNFKTPVVELGGSGAGIKEFCKGVGEDTIDIANSSRPIKKDEVQSCVDAGVKEIQEVKIGYDGIVFATDIAGPDWALEPKDIYKALAAKLVVDGKLVDNPNTKWSQVNPKLPDWDIAAYIPGEKHGTREVFEQKLLEAGCDKDAVKAAGVGRKGSHQDLHRGPQGRQGGRHRRRLHRDARPHRQQQDRRRRVRPRLLRKQRRQAEGRHRQGHHALGRDDRRAASIRCRARCSST